MTAAGATAELSYRPTLGGRAKKIAIDHKRLAKALQKPPKPVAKEWVVGKVERLAKDVQQFGINTADGLLHCPMDRAKEGTYLDCYTNDLTVDALVSFPPKPKSGTWLAKEIHEIIPRPEPQTFKDVFAESDIENIPGIIVPKRPLTFDAVIDRLAAGLTPEDADSLSDFLGEYKSL
jgi:hypothetical protein